MTDNDILDEYSPELITRREAVARVAALLGGVALIGGSALISGCRAEKAGAPSTPFTPDEIAYLDEIADTILPATSTPGAKAAKTGEFMARMVTDSYSLEDEKIFRAGMVKLDDASKDKNGGKTFMQATPEQRLALLKTLDKEQFDYSEKGRLDNLKRSKEFLARATQENAPKTESQAATVASEEPPNRYFRMMKELSLLGYFTSEIGCKQAQV
ncbi:MAG TPA: gluconate 2-dehydrogenase subunit 3 family protein, partial [Gemmatimonadaceae bacterium]|nr:gluconate 2-dehydrogenase subunit 3 family protein [Gemmatimonadaceae bacterium]